ncbi:MAG: TMEM165/GDT1 family protein [Clostridia bacterium]|nr:TMEM165/GDT1 family protein [Clostridia bacterium]
MNFLYPILIAFLLVFISELGDKTQLLVLSFSSKLKASTILLGVALGSLFSHGIAILFGSSIGLLENELIHNILQFITYFSFIVFGILSFLPEKDKREDNRKNNILMKLSKIGIGYILIIAISIAVGELGDKTFLASIGLGISYPHQKLLLIIGAILGMVLSDMIAILFGRFLSSKIPEKTISRLSGFLFIVFGIIGFIRLFI